MVAAQVLMGLSARSVAAIENVVTLPQLRVLVMVADHGSLNLGAVANALQVHPSNATRTVDRLVVAGLLDRRDNPADRRTVILELAPAGHKLVDRVMNHRRAAITEILDRMPVVQRLALAPVLRSFADAAPYASDNGLPDTTIWPLGWSTAS